MRLITEINLAEEEFFEKVWYDRHQMLLKSARKRFTPEILAEAEKQARRIEVKFGGQLGPYTDLQWGMLNGKLSALRWVQGSDWDFLDT